LITCFEGLKAGAQISALPAVLGLQIRVFSTLKLTLRVTSLRALLVMLLDSLLVVVLGKNFYF
jgi:hypothetical protein